MADGLYLGKILDGKTEALGEEFRLDPADLTTHGIVIGMTGSGKTGLSVVLIEEALQKGIPVIVIDPKGDMANLALAFPKLAASEFEPWIDASSLQPGGSPAVAAEGAATAWRSGLAEWGIDENAVAAYAGSHDVHIITPGSSASAPLNLIESLDPPSAEVMADAEEFQDQIDGIVTASLGLIGVKADPVESREYILLSTLIGNAWRESKALTLDALIGQVANPPIEKVGALPLDVVYPPADRNRLMLSLNNLLASPALAAWRQGEPVDIDAWLRSPDGKPRATIVYTAHLEEEQRLFVTALVLNRLVSWMRRQPGTSNLRALLYMDEIFGYFPPTANPPTKKPLLTLLKQARAYGLGVLLSTQNPVDLDYRGLANMGFWAIGRLQTTQDQARIRTGIEAALADSKFAQNFDDLIAHVQKRVFLVHDIHRSQPELVHSRWAMSYLRGPVTRDELSRLTLETAHAAATPTPSAIPIETPAPQRVAAAEIVSTPPLLPAPLRARYLTLRGGNVANPYLFVKASASYKIGNAQTPEQSYAMAWALDPSMGLAEALTGQAMAVEEASLSETAPTGVTYGDLPAFVSVDGAQGIERTLKARLDDALSTELLYDRDTRMLSHPGEDVDAFARRIQDTPALKEDSQALERKLADKRGELSQRQQEAKSRGFEKWASLGTSLLSNIGLFTGRKRTVTGLSGVLSKQRMENTAKSRIDRIEEDVAELEEQLAALSQLDPNRFERRTVKPTTTAVTLIRFEILWVN
jgi:hypothetical protein